MGYEMPDRPRFLENALQGFAFWIGHRLHCYDLIRYRKAQWLLKLAISFRLICQIRFN